MRSRASIFSVLTLLHPFGQTCIFLHEQKTAHQLVLNKNEPKEQLIRTKVLFLSFRQKGEITHVSDFRHFLELTSLELRRLQTPHQGNVRQQKTQYQADSLGTPVCVVCVTPEEKTVRESISLGKE